ncbi:MAG: caspase family protein [Deltaproteobacteria bacterium]|jgi:hypothetical protein|nr:caspase family protein [Deltaproteobacteria bacterium]
MTSNPPKTRRGGLAAKALAMAAAAMLALAFAQTAGADKHALLIGINEYSNGPFPPLEGAVNDVELMKGLLVSHLKFPPENITTLLDSQATRTGVIGAMEALAGRIAPGDMVYVQYSGHGSTTCDLNEDDFPRAFDSTLVTYGSRSGPNPTMPASCQAPPSRSAAVAESQEAQRNPDDFDLIDDRMNLLVAGLRAKADLVVFVSDSCFSGTITRGDQVRTRGIPMDARVNPDAYLTGPGASGQARGLNNPPRDRGAGRPTVLMGSQASIDAPAPDAGQAQDAGQAGDTAPPRRTLGDYIAIGSADQLEPAVEYKVNGKAYGTFTWFFAKSIVNAGPDDTWQRVVDRAKAYMNGESRGGQHQVVEGNPDRRLFEGSGGEPPAYLVEQTYPEGGRKFAKVNAGLLLNVGPGTVFVKLRPGASPLPVGGSFKREDIEARMTVVQASDINSDAEIVEGSVNNGDSLQLLAWQPPGQTYRISYRTDLPEDRELVPIAREVFRDLSMVEEVDGSDEGGGDGRAADIVCWILRPGGQQPTAEPADGTPGRFLPPSDPAARPEIWLVSPSEDSFLWGFRDLRMPLDGNGPDMLRKNFIMASKAHNLLVMDGPAGKRPKVNVGYLLFRETDETEWSGRKAEERFQFPAADGSMRRWVLSREIGADAPLERTDPNENVVMVKAENRTHTLFHIYGFNVTPDGKILSFLPNKQDRTWTELPPYMTVVFRDFPLELEMPGEFVRVIATTQALHVSDVEQMELAKFTGEVTRSLGMDTLNTLMAERMTLSRLEPGMAAAGDPNEWFTTSVTFGD